VNGLRALTDFGDSAVLLPLALTLLIWLAFRSPRHLAPWWAGTFFVCAGITAVLKVYFFACPPLADLRSPSGHTALSMLVYGALAVVAAGQILRWRLVLIAGGAALALAIAASRVALHDHTILETVLGLVIGTAALALFAWRIAVHPLAAAPLWPLLVPVALVLIGLHGHELHAEEFLHAISTYMRHNGLACG
jgi:membrane-associated phospholipid phosphatase